MNKQLTTILSIVITLSVVACGGSGSIGFSGIGGSGFISSGSISGFGSVFVNGVEFETDNASFDVDGVSGTQDDLAIGMIVRVSGTINSDGVTGTATSISFDDELQGPVTALTAPDVDGITRSFTVLGSNVIIDSGSTTFDISDNVPANTSFGFSTISDNNNVEISGFFNSSGDLVATRVELKDILFDISSIIEVKGTISLLSGTTFNLGSLVVDASSATIDDLLNGLVDGELVEVKGTLNAGTVIASKVEGKDTSIDDSNEFELEGIVTDYIDDSTFKISGISVDASNAVKQPLSLNLANDIRVEAEGAVVNGILVATEIELEGGDIKVHAEVSSVNVGAATFTVRPVTGQPEITVIVTSDTQLQDEVNDIEPYTLTNLFNDLGFVEVRGFDDGSGAIIATEIDVTEQDDVIVQGEATAATGSATTGGMITVLGVEFSFDALTDFEDKDDNDMTQVQIDSLINGISPATPQLIKIKDNEAGTGGNATGFADEIDIE